MISLMIFKAVKLAMVLKIAHTIYRSIFLCATNDTAWSTPKSPATERCRWWLGNSPYRQSFFVFVLHLRWWQIKQAVSTPVLTNFRIEEPAMFLCCSFLKKTGFKSPVIWFWKIALPKFFEEITAYVALNSEHCSNHLS